MEVLKPLIFLVFTAVNFSLLHGENHQSLLKNVPINIHKYPAILDDIAPYRSIGSLIKPEIFHSLQYSYDESTAQCFADWAIIMKYTLAQDASVFKFWDSYAIIGSGIIDGNFLFIGQPEECVNVKKDPSPVPYPDFPDTKPLLVGLNIVVNVSDSLVSLPPLTTGVCMPRSCSTKDAKIIVEMGIARLELENPPEVTYVQEKTEFKVDTSFVFAVVIFGTLGLLIVIATSIGVYDILSERYIVLKRTTSQKYSTLPDGNVQGSVGDAAAAKTAKPMYMKLLMCFDFTANFAKIMETPKTQQQNSSLAVLNGVRVMSMGWVILGHLLLHSISFLIFDNDLYVVYSRSSNFLFQVAGNCSLSVDSFFILSGLLVMLGTLRTLEKVNNPYSVKFWLMFYVHRIVRLWPVLLLTLLFIKGLYPTFSGLFYSPMFALEKKTNIVKLCEGTQWLQTAFFYNNWVVADEGKCCMAWTWYLSNDMQFYIISPLFVLLVKKNRMWGCGAIVSATLASTIFLLCINSINKLPLFAAPGEGTMAHEDWSDRAYRSFYCRFQTYGVGLLFGVLAYDHESLRAKLHHHFKLNYRILIACVFWLLSFVLGSAALFGAYPSLNGHMMSQAAIDIFNSTYRILWGFAVGVLIILCSWGYGGHRNEHPLLVISSNRTKPGAQSSYQIVITAGIINSILSYRIFAPLARIGYTVYIIHVVCLMTWVDSTEKTTRYNILNVSVLFSGFFVCIYCVAMIVSCVIEAPFIQLEKILLRPKSS